MARRPPGGKGLFAAFDGNETVAPTPEQTPIPPKDEDAPGAGMLAAMAMLALALVLRRRR